MKRIDARIERCKASLEALFIKARAGENCMDEVIRLSKELDRLINEKAGNREK